MQLLAVYVNGGLLDQVPAENEDTCISKIKLEYPGIGPKDEIEVRVVDPNYEVTETSAQEETNTDTLDEVEQMATHEGPKPFIVIKAAKINITLDVAQGVISEDDIKKLEKAAEEGMIIAQKEGTTS